MVLFDKGCQFFLSAGIVIASDIIDFIWSCLYMVKDITKKGTLCIFLLIFVWRSPLKFIPYLKGLIKDLAGTSYHV